MRRLLAAVLTVAGAAVISDATWAVNFTADRLIQVSGRSPFATCTADNVASQSGTVFLHSEVEPWIDVNPRNPKHLVGAFQQDRWSNGGARGLVAAVSVNGGSTWKTVVIPGISRCSGGLYDRSTDPWVSFGPDGTVHQLALSFNDINEPIVEGEGGDFDHALLYSRSADGGRTWTPPVVVMRDLDANVFNDKQSITADPTDRHYVYAVWDRLVFPPAERASVIAGFVTAAFRGPAWFARTTDGGRTWEPARMIYDPGQESQTIANQIVVLPNGDLVNIFDLIQINRRAIPTGAFFTVAVIRSTDRGETWGPVVRGKITPILVSQLRTIGITDPETGEPVRTGDIIPDIAAAPNGDLYAVWQDARPNNLQADAIVVSKSTDGGFTWSAPVKVNKTPTAIPIKNQQAFTPSVHVMADGTVAVTYYDFRHNDADAPLWTDYFIVHCHPDETPSACTTPGDWHDEIRLTATSFDMRQAPFAGGFFTGDYQGLSATGTDFAAFFSQTHGSDPGSIFFRRVGLGP